MYIKKRIENKNEVKNTSGPTNFLVTRANHSEDPPIPKFWHGVYFQGPFGMIMGLELDLDLVQNERR